MFLVQISLLVITFLSLTSRVLPLMQPPKKSIHTFALRHVSICGVSSSSSPHVACSIIGAWICHIAHEGQVGGQHVKMDHVL